MAKKISQVRYGTNDTNATALALISGSAFNEYVAGGIDQLGIQAIPGTMFYLNGSPDPIIIGTTGIYELDLNGQASITGLRFNERSIDRAGITVLVDMVYNKEG